jgi:hypothetical protein
MGQEVSFNMGHILIALQCIKYVESCVCSAVDIGYNIFVEPGVGLVQALSDLASLLTAIGN